MSFVEERMNERLKPGIMLGVSRKIFFFPLLPQLGDTGVSDLPEATWKMVVPGLEMGLLIPSPALFSLGGGVLPGAPVWWSLPGGHGFFASGHWSSWGRPPVSWCSSCPDPCPGLFGRGLPLPSDSSTVEGRA